MIVNMIMRECVGKTKVVAKVVKVVNKSQVK